MTTNFDILERAEQLELLAAELYAELALHFSADPVAMKLFSRLRLEEEQHAARVRMVAAQARKDTRLLGRIDAEPAAMDAVAREVRSMILDVRAGRWNADLPRTRALLLDLEARCSRAHVESLQGVHESLRTFFQQLAAQDEAHAELLRG